MSLSALAQATIDNPEPDQPPSTPGAWEIPAIVLAGLTRAQRESLAARLVALRRVLEPDPDDDRPILQRYGDEAAALGVSRRTLQRQAARLQELGPAGLVDGRVVQDDRPSVDPRWDEACRGVLASVVNASNPTRQHVINRTN